MTWGDMQGKTWADLQGQPEPASEPVTQDVQERMEQLIADVETLTARVSHLERFLPPDHERWDAKSKGKAGTEEAPKSRDRNPTC